jgi:2,3-bisphosphoglycerate-dependent phosphoglycerate mutase
MRETMNNVPEGLRHRPFLTPIWLTVIAAFLAFAAVLAAAVTLWEWGTADSTTVIVIRHAEKDLGGGTDPNLTAQGEARAALLAHMFGTAGAHRGIEAIYVSPTLRSRATAAPLAAALNLTPVVAPADDAKDLAQRALRDHAGGRVLIVGHSDTVPAIVAELSGERNIPKIADSEYGAMYIVTVPRFGHANLVRLNY